MVGLAIPAAASALLNNAFRVIDQQAAGSIGTSAQAAIGSCTFVLIGAYAVHDLAAAGASPLLGRATGAENPEERRRVFGSALLLAGLAGLLLSAFVVPAAPLLAQLLGLTGPTAADATTFLRTLAIFALPTCLFPLVDATFVSMGRTRTMMVLQFAAAILNAALNPLLIHQFGLGVAGAALATAAARTFCVSIGLYVLAREIGLKRSDLQLTEARRIIRIGSPVSLNILFYAMVYWALLHVAISPLGPSVNAALGIGFSALEGVSYPCFLGLSLAVSSIVSRRLGAREPEQAVRAGTLALPVTTVLGLLVGMVFYFGAAPLCGFFTKDPAVLTVAIGYAQTLAISQVCVAWEALAEGILLGSGDTRTVFRWSVPINLLRVPLAWLFAFPLGMGAPGVWWAINLTSLTKALGKGAAALRGDWQRIRL